MSAATHTVPMYSCEGARVLRDQDGIAFIEIDDNEATDEDWDRLLAWVYQQGFTFGHWGPLRNDAEDFDDGYGDRYILVSPEEEVEVAA